MLGFSPDWDARYCYLIVLLCGILSATIQVQGRLDILRNKAIYALSLGTTWVVFTIYLIIPLVVFWLLDRTGALRDTSVFAAFLVGLAYPAVLSGDSSVKPAAGIAAVVGWLNKAADSLVAKTTAYVAVEDRLFMRQVLAQMLPPNSRQSEVEKLALQYADSPPLVVQAELNKTSSPEEKAQIAYDYATNSAYGLRPLGKLVKSWKLKGVRFPYHRAWTWLLVYATILVIITLIIVIVMFVGPGDEAFRVWRLGKAGNSITDVQRNREVIEGWLDPKNRTAERVRSRLAVALQQPGLELSRADEILSLLLLNRGKYGEPQFIATGELLSDGLRCRSVDVRARINYALLSLADEYGTNSAESPRALRLKELRKWQPLATESPIDLEQKWGAWHSWWADYGAADAR